MIAERVQLNLPHGAVIRGAIYSSMEIEYLREDLIEIDLPNGWTVDAGWVPHGDPQGAYRIRMFWQYLTDTKMELYAKDPATAALLIERFAASSSELTHTEVFSAAEPSETEYKYGEPAVA